jgi:hypothetical protein
MFFTKLPTEACANHMAWNEAKGGGRKQGNVEFTAVPNTEVWNFGSQ